LPFLITAGTFVLSFTQQYRQHADETQATRDSEWRKAVQQVSSKESDVAIQGAYEMESFLDDQQHGPQALATTSALLPNVNDQSFFDIILFSLISKANQKNQGNLIVVDAALARQLKDEHDRIAKSLAKQRSPADKTFANFLMHPEDFYSDSQSDKLNYVLSKTWELDSASRGLAKLWKHETTEPGLSPDGHSLDGVVLFNHDFSGVDFRHAQAMDNVLFVGNCKVDKSELPSPGPEVHCAAPPAAP
jgi:hypothetical protein